MIIITTLKAIIFSTQAYGVFSGPCFPVFGPNTGKHGAEKLRLWTLFTQWLCRQHNMQCLNLPIHGINQSRQY